MFRENREILRHGRRVCAVLLGEQSQNGITAADRVRICSRCGFSSAAPNSISSKSAAISTPCLDCVGLVDAVPAQIDLAIQLTEGWILGCSPTVTNQSASQILPRPKTILGAHITVASSVARIVGSQRFNSV
jgi:hypothetical protein